MIQKLGKKITPNDIDGRKHQVAFRIFVVVMLAAIIVVGWHRAQASTSTWHIKNISGPCYDACIKHIAQWSGDGHRFVNKNNWTKAHEEHHIWDWEDWNKDRFTHYSGITTAPDGTKDVSYRTQIIWGTHKTCGGIYINVCLHASHASKLQTFANGQIRYCDRDGSDGSTWQCVITTANESRVICEKVARRASAGQGMERRGRNG